MTDRYDSQSGTRDELETLRQIVFGEHIESLRGSLSHTESSLSSQLSGLRDEVGRALGQLRADIAKESKAMGHTVYEEEKRRVAAVQGLENEINSVSQTVEQKLTGSAHQTKKRLDQLEEQVAAKVAQTERKIEQVERRISELNDALEGLKEQGSKVSSVLQNFAQIIAGSTAASAMVEQTKPSKAPKAAERERPAAHAEQAPAQAPRQPQREAPKQPQPAQQAPRRAAPQEAPAATAQKPPHPPRTQSAGYSPFEDNRDLPEGDEFLRNIDQIFKLGS